MINIEKLNELSEKEYPFINTPDSRIKDIDHSITLLQRSAFELGVLRGLKYSQDKLRLATEALEKRKHLKG